MESSSADRGVRRESNTNDLKEYPLRLQCIYASERLSLRLEIAPFTHSPFYTSTPPTVSLPISLSVTSFITVCFVIIFLYSKPHFLLVEIDSSDDTKQFISPFIPCFLLIAPPSSAPLSLRRGIGGGGRVADWVQC